MLSNTIVDKLQAKWIDKKDADRMRNTISIYEKVALESKTAITSNTFARLNLLIDRIANNEITIGQFIKMNEITHIDFVIQLFLIKKIELNKLIHIDNDHAYKLFLAKDFIKEDILSIDEVLKLDNERLKNLNHQTLQLFKNKKITLDEIFKLTNDQSNVLNSLADLINIHKYTLSGALKSLNIQHVRKIANVFPLIESKQIRHNDATGMSEHATQCLKMLTPLILANKLGVVEALRIINNPTNGCRNDATVLYHLSSRILSGEFSIEQALLMRKFYNILDALAPLIPTYVSMVQLLAIYNNRSLFSINSKQAQFYNQIANHPILIEMIVGGKIKLDQLANISVNHQAFSIAATVSELLKYGIISLEETKSLNKDQADILKNVKDLLILKVIDVKEASQLTHIQSQYLSQAYYLCVANQAQIKQLVELNYIKDVAKIINEYTHEGPECF